MCKSHRLGSAKTDTGYYNYWRPLVNKQATNAFWNNSKDLKFYEKGNVMMYGTGTIFFIKNTPTATAYLPMQTAPSALARIVRFTYSQVANTLKLGT